MNYSTKLFQAAAALVATPVVSLCLVSCGGNDIYLDNGNVFEVAPPQGQNNRKTFGYQGDNTQYSGQGQGENKPAPGATDPAAAAGDGTGTSPNPATTDNGTATTTPIPAPGNDPLPAPTVTPPTTAGTDPAPQPGTGASPTAKPPVKPGTSLPYGLPVIGKKGFVYSPFAPEKGLVDVSELNSGTKVECPYTFKHFRVP